MKSGLALVLDLHPDRTPRELATAFPHILDRIGLLWGTPELDTYFQHLMLDDRGNRSGFPPEVMRELAFLFELSIKYRAQGIGIRKTDPWDLLAKSSDRR
ncbi:MAG: hypothetical protein ACKVP2_13555 [Burkholderiales bacterium]